MPAIIFITCGVFMPARNCPKVKVIWRCEILS